MHYLKTLASACLLIVAPLDAFAQDSIASPSGPVTIVGAPGEMKSVRVGEQTLPLDEFHARLTDRLGNLVLIELSSGGTACPANYAWLNTTPGAVGLSETFGTCSDLPKITHDSETVTVTLPSFQASEGKVAFVYDGKVIKRKVLGLSSSSVARDANGDPNAWIGESPYEYLTAAENEPDLIAEIGWQDLDALRNTMVVGTQKMVVEGDWIVGTGCRPHVCNTDFAGIALNRNDGTFIAALKQSGQPARLLGIPSEALPPALRQIMLKR